MLLFSVVSVLVIETLVIVIAVVAVAVIVVVLVVVAVVVVISVVLIVAVSVAVEHVSSGGMLCTLSGFQRQYSINTFLWNKS